MTATRWRCGCTVALAGRAKHGGLAWITCGNSDHPTDDMKDAANDLLESGRLGEPPELPSPPPPPDERDPWTPPLVKPSERIRTVEEWRATEKRWQARKQAAAPRAARATGRCKQGHDLNEHGYIVPTGKAAGRRYCLLCQKERHRRRYGRTRRVARATAE